MSTLVGDVLYHRYVLNEFDLVTYLMSNKAIPTSIVVIILSIKQLVPVLVHEQKIILGCSDVSYWDLRNNFFLPFKVFLKGFSVAIFEFEKCYTPKVDEFRCFLLVL